MRPSPFRALLVAGLVLAGPALLQGQSTGSSESLRSETSSRETARFLLAPIGARHVGLAGAVTASVADAEGVLWNPASVAGLQTSTAFFHVSNDFGSNSQVLGVLWNWNRAEIGLTYYHFDLGTIEARDAANQDLGTIELDDDEFIVTAGYALRPGLDLGVNYKLIRLRSACSGECDSFGGRSVGHAFDLGVVGRLSGVPGLSLGAMVRNLGPGVALAGGDTSDPMPARVRIGVAVDVTQAFLRTEERFGIAVEADLQQTVTEFDDLDAYVGAELSLRRILYVRGGYAWASTGRTGPSLGLGLRYDRLVVDVGRAFDDFASFDSGTPFQLSIAFRI